jgi:hypothetical protein
VNISIKAKLRAQTATATYYLLMMQRAGYLGRMEVAFSAVVAGGSPLTW